MLNCPDNKKIEYFNSLNIIKDKYKHGNNLIFDVQNNSKNCYYGDYGIRFGNTMYNFSFAPIPDYNQSKNIIINVNLPTIKYNLSIENNLTISKPFDINLVIKSLCSPSNLTLNGYLDNKKIYNHKETFLKGNAKNIEINTTVGKAGVYNFKILLGYHNNRYNYTYFSEKQISVYIGNNIDKYNFSIHTNINGNWLLIINNKDYKENQGNITITLNSGIYRISIIKNGYEEKKFEINMDENKSIYLTLQKIKKLDYWPIVYLPLLALIIASIATIYFYSNRTIECNQCHSKYYKSYDKCPVCLTPSDKKIKKNK
jgi:hypothetical protein